MMYTCPKCGKRAKLKEAQGILVCNNDACFWWTEASKKEKHIYHD